MKPFCVTETTRIGHAYLCKNQHSYKYTFVVVRYVICICMCLSATAHALPFTLPNTIHLLRINSAPPQSTNH